MAAIQRPDRRKAIFDYLENEVSSYRENLQWLSDVCAECTSQTDPELERVATAVVLAVTQRLRAIGWAIQKIQEHPDPARWEFVRLRYIDEHLPAEEIMQRLHIGSDTFYRWRREFLTLVAHRLGLLLEEL